MKPAATPERQGVICLVPCSPGERLSAEHSRVDIRYMSVNQLILTAYRIKSYQLSGPDWTRTERFDIAAKMPDGASQDQIPEMLQALLAERFKLSIHRDKKELPVYALVVGKDGPKLQAGKGENIEIPNTAGSRALYTPEGDARMLPDNSFVSKGGPLGAMRGGIGSNGGMKFEFLNLTMPGLAELVGAHMDRPVVDQTGLPGGYYLTVVNPPPSDDGGRKGSEAPEGGRAGGGAPDARSRPSRFADILIPTIEKAGLKLDKTKASIEMIVVDHLGKTPTEN